MRIIESNTRGKHGDDALNEDGFFVGDNVVAVIDGVTSKAQYGLWDPTPGVVAKNVLIKTLRRLDKDCGIGDGSSGLRAMQHQLDGALRAEYEAYPLELLSRRSACVEITDAPAEPNSSLDFFRRHPNERLQANAVVYDAREREIWMFGDCQAMVNGRQIPSMKKVDALMGEVRSFIAHAHDYPSGDIEPADDPGRRAILPLLRAQSFYANRPGEYGYFVFDGFTAPDWPITTIAVHPGDEVVLASDGYPFPQRTLAQSEKALAKLFTTIRC